MYHTGLDPRDMSPVYVPKTPHEKAMQRALLQFKNPANHELVCEALRLCGRDDLIGFGPKALVAPRVMSRQGSAKKAATQKEYNKSSTRQQRSSSHPQKPRNRQIKK